jgi:hypothetical protein
VNWKSIARLVDFSYRTVASPRLIVLLDSDVG